MTAKETYRQFCREEHSLPLFSNDWWLDAVCGNEQRALAMANWQLKELKWNGVSMTSATKAILAVIRASKIQRIAA